MFFEKKKKSVDADGEISSNHYLAFLWNNILDVLSSVCTEATITLSLCGEGYAASAKCWNWAN